MTYAGILALTVTGFSLFPARVLLWASQRMRTQTLTDRATWRLLHGLFITIVMLMMVVYAMERSAGLGDSLYIVSAPTIVTFTAIACLLICSTPTLHNPRTAVTVLGYLIAAALVNIWHLSKGNSGSDGMTIVLAMVSAGLVIALIWQTVQRQQRWLWLGLIALVAAAAINDFAYNGLLANLPGGLLWLLNFICTFLIPVSLIALAGRTAVYLAEKQERIVWRRWISGAAAAGVLIVLLALHIVKMFLLDGFDDWGTIGLPLFFAIAGNAVALVLLWTVRHHPVRTAVIYAVAMTACIFGFFVVIHQFNDSPEQTTTARVIQVDEAIQQYYADHQQYPADLYALVPGYLAAIPNPVLFYEQSWCYEGDSNAYRLGFVNRPAPGTPPETYSVYVYSRAGSFLPRAWACDQQLADYTALWNRLFPNLRS